jgi:hypothetical protein
MLQLLRIRVREVSNGDGYAVGAVKNKLGGHELQARLTSRLYDSQTTITLK